MEILKVIDKGIHTTVQDLGRYEYKQYGVPQSGAMDSFAARCANILADNEESKPLLEVTYGLFKCKFLNNAVISITGGDLGAVLNGKAIPMWQTLHVKKDDMLDFTGGDGFRAYLAIGGGIHAKKVLGSYSTCQRAGFGTVIQNGQIISGTRSVYSGRKIMLSNHIPCYDNVVRFIKGPHIDFFKKGQAENLTDGEYIISPDSDRMGLRLKGKEIVTKNKDLISCPLPIGAIQVPTSNQPIVTMADGQVTGGYPIVGCVISSDIPKLAQQKPNSKIRFEEVSTLQAAKIKKEMENKIMALKNTGFIEQAAFEYNVKINGNDYFVQVFDEV